MVGGPHPREPFAMNDQTPERHAVRPELAQTEPTAVEVAAADADAADADKIRKAMDAAVAAAEDHLRQPVAERRPEYHGD